MSTEELQTRLLARGVEFPEGPSVAPDGTIFAVDIPTSRIVTVQDGECVEWLNTSLLDVKGKPNGSKFWGETLFVCDSGRKQMLAIAPDKTITVVADKANGDLVNGPNDCVFDSLGNFYFSDPNYDKQTASVYFCKRNSDNKFSTTEFAAGFDFPNGVALSADEAHLYIAETGRNQIWKYERKADGTAGDGAVWCELPPSNVGPDGMGFDDKGRLFVAHFGTGKIRVLNNNGEIVHSLDAGGKDPTNVAFSPDFKTLYVTETETKAIYEIDISSMR